MTGLVQGGGFFFHNVNSSGVHKAVVSDQWSVVSFTTGSKSKTSTTEVTGFHGVEPVGCIDIVREQGPGS
jgi:hypothetical protein